jgi:feruloyl esterase
MRATIVAATAVAIAAVAGGLTAVVAPRVAAAAAPAVTATGATAGLASTSHSTTAFALAAGIAPDAQSCTRLASLALPLTTITLAQVVDGGTFAPPRPADSASSAAAPAPLRDLPAFCRVAATLTPSSDSDIRIEVWLPIATWNGKLETIGNGGWSGAIGYSGMSVSVRHGYATTSTNTGHDGSSGSFALGHPEKLIDFAYRSEHEMTVVAKAVIAVFYGQAPRYAYWHGCSGGGRQALKEAQRFPDDYDGIIAGAPASDWTGRAIQSMRIAQVTHSREGEGGSYIPPAKYRLIHDAALAACDAIDGVKDGLIADPLRCHFDPQVLACKDAAATETAACLTKSQVDTARAIYETKVNPKIGRDITGLQPGSEPGWNTWAGPQPFGIGYDHFRFVVFKDPAWDFHTLRFDTDVVRAEQIDHDTINAIDPNLRAFFAHRGKLIQYHGWNDPQISPGSSVNYYTSVVSALGGAANVDASYRLFMVPGMGHCSGGEGPNTFDMLAALEEWVEAGRAPDRIIAAHLTGGQIDRTRPLCPYPQMAAYTGTGSMDDAANFVCKLP